MTTEIADALENHELFKRLSQIERGKLAAVGEHTELQPDTVLFRQGEPSNGMYVLQEGHIELSRVNRQGRRFVLARLKPGDTFGELSVLDHGPRPVTAETVDDVEVILFSNEGIQSLIDQRDRAALELLHLLSVQSSRRLRELNRAIVETLNEPTALGGETLHGQARPDRDFFHGLMAGLYTGRRGDSS